MERTGLAESTIYQKMAEATFPKQFPLGPRAVAWLQCEIEEWQKDKINKKKKAAK